MLPIGDVSADEAPGLQVLLKPARLPNRAPVHRAGIHPHPAQVRSDHQHSQRRPYFPRLDQLLVVAAREGMFVQWAHSSISFNWLPSFTPATPHAILMNLRIDLAP